MRIDQTHRKWFRASLVILLCAAAIYVPYALTSPTGAHGGSAIGLMFGIVGYGFMIYAGLLGARKKVRIWRVGRAQTWMRGHLWLGTLSLPMILFHSGFAARGPLTWWLMLLLFIVVFSGVSGALLQHYMPNAMLQRVPLETIYEQIPHVRTQLKDEADALAGAVNSSAAPKTLEASVGMDARSGRAAVKEIVEVEQEEREEFRRVYLETIRPYITGAKVAALDNEARSAEVFGGLRRALPVALGQTVSDLESICEEERQFRRQENYYRLLHGWLLVHVPLSIAVLLLGGVHALIATLYR